MNAQVDLITPKKGIMKASGDLAALLLNNNFDVNALRTNDVLQKDEWLAFDNSVVEVAQERLVVTGEFVSRGLTYDLPNAMGHTRLEWQRMSDMTDADISMSGLTESQNDRIEYDLASTPIPIIHKDFQINARALAASRNKGTPLDTAQIRLATRNVSERLERLVLSGATIGGTNGTIYGIFNAPNRTTGSVTASWVSATGAQILTDVLAMIDDAADNNMFGPFVLFIPQSANTNLDNDFKAESDKTIRQRLLELDSISKIVPTPFITAPNVALVQMTQDVMDIIDGIQPTVVQWDSHGGMVMNFKVMTIMVPRARSDFENQSGIVHYS